MRTSVPSERLMTLAGLVSSGPHHGSRPRPSACTWRRIVTRSRTDGAAAAISARKATASSRGAGRRRSHHEEVTPALEANVVRHLRNPSRGRRTAVQLRSKRAGRVERADPSGEHPVRRAERDGPVAGTTRCPTTRSQLLLGDDMARRRAEAVPVRHVLTLAPSAAARHWTHAAAGRAGFCRRPSRPTSSARLGSSHCRPPRTSSPGARGDDPWTRTQKIRYGLRPAPWVSTRAAE